MSVPPLDGAALASALARPAIVGMTPQRYPDPSGLRLDLNTNLFGPNPAVAQVAAALAEGRLDLTQYPQSDAAGLRSAYAKHLHVGPEQLCFGNGSDEMIDLLFKAYVDPTEVVAWAVPTFSMYRFYATVAGARVVEASFGPSFSLPEEELLAARPKVLVLCSPNNPTGSAVATSQMYRLATLLRDRPTAEGGPGLLVLDEAYGEFGGAHHASSIAAHPNLVVLRTLSKAMGLAGARIGMAIADGAVMDRIAAVKPPFNLNEVSIALAHAALDHLPWVEQVAMTVVQERQWLAQQLQSRGYVVHPSSANFLLVRPPGEVDEVVRRLAAAGLVVRHFPHQPALAGHVRLTVPPREVGQRLLAVIDTMGGSDGR